jgi:signal-transduction protein with cAMP-binding, CBS, and nucleotidyltransferase domain
VPIAPAVTPSRKLSHLRNIELFDDATPTELVELARAFDLCTAHPGQTLQAQDVPVRRWNVIAIGHVLVARDGAPLGVLGRGQSWSDHSILNGQRSPISAAAFSPVTLLSISSRRLLALLESQPGLRDRLESRSAGSADRLALPFYRALTHMSEHDDEEANRRAALEPVLLPH